MTSAPVRIGVLKHRAAGDPLAARRRLESVLDQADLEPSGLGPSATLYVRRLDDPRPRTLDLSGRGPAAPAWGQAVASLLDAALRQAVRPALGAVPASADAVLFVDEAERLSCLVNDWIRGLVTQRWWWQALEPRAGPRAVVLGALVERPRQLPPVLDRLAGDRMAESFLRQLEVHEARLLTDVVLQSFGLTRLDHVVRRLAGRSERAAAGSSDRTGSPIGAGTPGQRSPRGGEGQSGRPPKSSRPVPAPPWASIVPESAALSDLPMQQFLLGVALGLVRAGSVVRTSAYASAAVRWSRQARGLPDLDRGTSGMPQGSVRVDRPERISSHRRAADVAPPERQTGRPTAAVEQAPAHIRVDADRQGEPMDRAGDRRPVDIARIDAEALRPALPDRVNADPWAVGGRRDRDGDANVAPPLDVPTSTTTHLGGVLYLLNVALAIGLYNDFTRPATPGIALDPWDFVALVARRLGAGMDAPDDPIWQLLDRLAGREWHTRPGHGFRPAADWRMDQAWLRPFAADRRAWRWWTDGGRTVVRHPAGFLILDVRTSSGVGGPEVRRLLERYRPHPRLRRVAPPPPLRRSSLDRWLDNVTDYVRARLIPALGLPDASRLVSVVLRHDAEVLVTASAVDVRLTLADLPIAVRAAGLDRDPGWIPAAGRAIAFHYT